MKKWLAALLLLVGLLLGACNSDTANEEQNNATQSSQETFETVTIVDALDNEVTLENAPKKIISMVPSNTEILFALGLENEIVAVGDNDNYPEAALEKEKIGGMEFDVEKMIALKPDLVVAHESGMYGFEAGLEQLKSVGINVFVVKNAVTFEETYETIDQIAKLTGTQDEGKEIIEAIQLKLAAIQEKVKDQPTKNAFLLVGATPDLYAAGKNTFMDEMLKVIHVENVVTEESWIKYSAEDFVASNPNAIIVTYEEDIKTIQSNAAFAEMDAVKNKQLFVVDGDTTSRQGPRLAEGVESMAKVMYPEAFGE